MIRTDPATLLPATDAGRLSYEAGFALQQEAHARVLAQREVVGAPVGELLLVEHDAVITVSRRAGAAEHLLASKEQLARVGVEVRETDRGGDITYHGPGQLVVYPILDLNRLKIGLHEYMRSMEEIVIGVCRSLGVRTGRDTEATGVWTVDDAGRSQAKICAMGIRVRRWVSMHGLALNVNTNLDHFDLIVPCGLEGRAVTSLERELGKRVDARAVQAEIARGFQMWAQQRLSEVARAEGSEGEA